MKKQKKITKKKEDKSEKIMIYMSIFSLGFIVAKFVLQGTDWLFCIY